MKLKFPPFKKFIKSSFIPRTISRANDSDIIHLDVSATTIKAVVQGTNLYNVNIVFNPQKVLKASCNCPYDQAGYCKHIANVIQHADDIISDKKPVDNFYQNTLFGVEKKSNIEEATIIKDNDSIKKLNVSFLYNTKTQQLSYTIDNQKITDLTQEQILSVTSPKLNRYNLTKDFKIQNVEIHPNKISAIVTGNSLPGFGKKQGLVSVFQAGNSIQATCSCGNATETICQHVFFVFSAVINQHLYFHFAFDELERHKYLREYARKLGVPHLENPDEIFSLFIPKAKLTVREKVSLFSPRDMQFDDVILQLEQATTSLPIVESNTTTQYQDFILFKTKTLYDQSQSLNISLLEAPLTKSGTMKNSVRYMELSKRIKNAKNQEEIDFFSNSLSLIEPTNKSAEELKNAYRSILKNPLQLPIYRHHSDFEWERFSSYSSSTSINVHDLKQIELLNKSEYFIAIHVKKHSQEFYAIELVIEIDKKRWTLEDFELFDTFIFIKQKFIFIENSAVLETIYFLKERKNGFLVQKTLFPDFQQRFIRTAEQHISVVYDFALKSNPKKSRKKELSSQQELKRLIYLSESQDYILITPTIRYGNVEVGVFSQKNIYTQDESGNIYEQQRDREAEKEFIELIQTQHPNFAELPNSTFFYLHYSEFLNNLWFQDAFQTWKDLDIEVLGYKNLKNNYNPNKMSARVNIASRMDWFDLETDVSFGDQHVSLQEIQRSIVNKNHFVVLSDGSKGLLPEEWISKFERYFRNGELKNGNLRIHKSNFQLIDELFEKETLPETIQIELAKYLEKLASFQSIQQTELPKKLRATLREYQKEGLNWLNFLYEFNFGGCLADDMGLGKTVQIIAYLLSRQEKGNTLPNLVVMPTSLLFNWKHEIEKFAPDLRYIILHGNNRQTENVNFSEFDLIFTSYGTLLSDVDILRKQQFDVIVLDESQAIKNPTSKRYKAVQLLQSRQRVVATGTPIENNTFDLYAQLSFAMPGLLGSQKQFATNYSTPIDKFGDGQRAKELHQKIHPFVLRRTKQQVATELPPKTEIIHYCPMEKHQQKVYDAYKTEFQRYLSGLSDQEMNKSSLHVLQGLTKLRQICNSPALLSDEEFYGEESAKIDELTRQIEQLKDNHKILVFSQFVSMLELIQKRLEAENISYSYLTGQTKDRQQQVERFQNDSSVRVFLISLKAGGTGLNLTEAEYVFLVDPWWNPAVENQAIDRAYRIGQKNKVIATRLITPNTIEEKIMELQQRKSQLAQDLIRTDDQIFKRLTKDELINIL